ncbi:hypothetical protein [Acinetobacter phage Ab69]|nr:hypothetical protein [Acinetobacter phage Ab69]
MTADEMIEIKAYTRSMKAFNRMKKALKDSSALCILIGNNDSQYALNGKMLLVMRITMGITQTNQQIFSLMKQNATI